MKLGPPTAAHDALFGQAGASIGNIVSEALRPFVTRERLTANGPDLIIGAEGAVNLALLLNELATNAIKYGALSTRDGRIELSWHVEDETFRLDWREIGGPPPVEPERLGFGSRLIDRGLGRRGRVARRDLPTGFVAEVATPLTDIQPS